MKRIYAAISLLVSFALLGGGYLATTPARAQVADPCAPTASGSPLGSPSSSPSVSPSGSPAVPTATTLDGRPEDSTVQVRTNYLLTYVARNAAGAPVCGVPVFFISEGVGRIVDADPATNQAGEARVLVNSFETGLQTVTGSLNAPRNSSQCDDPGTATGIGTGCDEVRVNWVGRTRAVRCSGGARALDPDPTGLGGDIKDTEQDCPQSNMTTSDGLDPLLPASRTVGPDGSSTSSSAVSTTAPFTITVIGASSSSQCDSNGNATLTQSGGRVLVRSGMTTIADFTPGANTMLTLAPGIMLFLNEQSGTVNNNPNDNQRNSARGSVTGARLVTPAGEVKIAQASSDVTCNDTVGRLIRVRGDDNTTYLDGFVVISLDVFQDESATDLQGNPEGPVTRSGGIRITDSRPSNPVGAPFSCYNGTATNLSSGAAGEALVEGTIGCFNFPGVFFHDFELRITDRTPALQGETNDRDLYEIVIFDTVAPEYEHMDQTTGAPPADAGNLDVIV